MSTVNPYAIPDEELDDLAPNPITLNGSRKHNLTGGLCTACDITHDVKVPKDVPVEILDALSNLLDSLPKEVLTSEIILARSTPERARIVADFLEFTETLDASANDGPLLRAMAEVINQMSDGQVESLWRVYQSERELMISHTLMKSINTMMMTLQSNHATSRQGADDDTLIGILNELFETTNQRIVDATARYRTRAQECNYEVDTQIIEAGVFDETKPRSRFADHTMGELLKNYSAESE